ncbi:hypothetical protein FRC00_002897, partial [Tulasnella sp. 408]
MPPPKKRQKVDGNGSANPPRRSTTLLDFFQGPAGRPAVGGAGTASNGSRGKHKVEIFPEDADIIVISDDEDPQLQPPVAPAGESSSIGSSTSSDISLPNRRQQFYELGGSGPVTSEHSLGDDNLPTNDQPETIRKTISEQPIPQRECTPPPPEPSILDLDAASAPNPFESSISRSIPDIQETGETEWLTGDDEIIEIEDDSDGEEGCGFEEKGSSREERSGDCLGTMVRDEAVSSSACPVCNVCVDGWSSDDLSEHVNACLDSPPTSKRPLTPRQGSSSRVPPQSSSKPPPSEPSGRGPNAFSLLMSSRKENEAWKLAEVDLAKPDSAIGKARRSEGRRKAPFYKVMQGMPIAVDAFRYGKIPG